MSKRPNGYWTEERVREEAKKYDTKSKFNRGSVSAYDRACRLGIINELFENKYRHWDEASARDEARKYGSKESFRRGCPAAYDHAYRLGIINDLGFPLGLDGSDNDAIYIWRAVGCVFNGNPVFKIGVTSQRLGTRRIEQVARAAGLEYELICCEPVLGRATLVEAKLHLLGEDPEMRGFDGATEFRALNKSALDAALSIIKANQ